MPLTIQGDLSRNTVHIDPLFEESCSTLLVLHGEGAVVRIGPFTRASNLFCTISSNARIEVGENCTLGSITLHALAEGASIKIGKEVGMQGSVDIGTHELSHIEIGDYSLLAGNVSITASDVHHIFDMQTGERLNPPRDIQIGKSVWIAAGCRVLRGSSIGEMSVVGAHSLVSGTFPANCLIAGSPARVIREGIFWKR